MQPRTRLIITYAATFLAGLLTGATVLSDVLRPPPESPPAPAPTAAVPAEPPLNIASVETAPPAPAEPPAPEPTPVAPPPATPAVSPEVTDELAERISELSNGWGRMQAELAELRHRVALVEQREPAGDSTAATEPRRRGPATPAEQRDALLRAGVTPELTDDLLWRRSQVALARLELRDEAAREGWLGTARYREEIGRLNEEQVSIEDEVGSDAYDRYLFATGQPNRVAVDSVLPGSAGEESGLMTGDVIERYGDTPVLDFEDLRAATSTGVRGELVPVSVVRAGQRMEVWLPRGPIGIGLDATRLDPNG